MIFSLICSPFPVVLVQDVARESTESFQASLTPLILHTLAQRQGVQLSTSACRTVTSFEALFSLIQSWLPDDGNSYLFFIHLDEVRGMQTRMWAF